VGYLLLDPKSRMALWWPPAGLYVAALLLVEPRRWKWLVAAGLPASVLGSLLAGRTPGLALALFAGNTVQALAAAWLVRRLAGPRASPSTVGGALALMLLPPLAFAVITAALRATALLGQGPFDVGFWAFTGGSATGVILVTPFLLTLAEPTQGEPTGPRARLLEGAAAGAALALALGMRAGLLGPVFAYAFVLFPPLVWAAVRLGPRGACAGLLIVAAASGRGGALWGGHRPSGMPAEEVLVEQAFLAILATTAVVLAAAAAERRRAIAELAESRDLLAAFVDNSPSPIFIKDAAGRILVLSRLFEGLLGKPRAELVGRKVAEVVPPPVGPVLEEAEQEVRRTGQAVSREIAFAGRSFLDLSFPIPRRVGPPFVGGFAVDVTDRVRAEEALRESEARLRLIESAVDQASDAIGVADEAGCLVWVNAAGSRYIGLPKDRMLGRPLWEISGGAEEQFHEHWRATEAAGVLVREQPVPVPGGPPLPGEVASTIIAFGGRRFFVLSSRDISDRRRADASARLAGIGRLAAGVAHEINNPLAYVIANVDWARERTAELAGQGHAGGADLDDLRRVLDDAQEGASRVREIVRDLRLFARPDEVSGKGDLRAAARSALAIAQNEIRHRARLESRLDEVPPVRGAEGRLGQVLLNLLVNAAQALPEASPQRHVVRLEVRRGGPGEVVAEVSDTGVGMTPEVRARVFEPFFTTKPVGSGTGLGLFVCHGIVQAMGGRIEVESEPGKGSTFRVVVPEAEPAAGPVLVADAPPGDGRPPRAPPAARRRILVVDDDVQVGKALRRILEPEHQVEVAEGGRVALERLRAGSAWDLVLCDVMMPDMSGELLFEALGQEAPHLLPRVAFITGGAFTPEARAFLDRVPNPRLDKPFQAHELRALVWRLLGG
jgi:PAS domain S-box-containing protein